MKKKMFFCILKVAEGFLYGSKSASGSSLDPLVRGTDPRARFRTTACSAHYNLIRYLFFRSNGFVLILT
jgi:hypothetical protein